MTGTWQYIGRWHYLLAAVVLWTVAGCAGSATDSPTDAQREFFAQLPPLPHNDAPLRSPSAIVPLELTGAENWDNSGNVTLDGDTLTVTSAAGRLDWVMYRYNVGLDTTLGDLFIDLATTSGEAYVLLSDYAAGFWELHGPYTSPVTIDLSAGDYLSSGNNVYAVVAVYDGAVVTVNSSSLEYDNQVSGADYLTDMAPIFADNCMPCHSTASATADIVLDTYWNANENSAAALAKALADHAPTGMATLTTDEKNTFQAWVDAGLPYGEAVTYTNFISGNVTNNCGPCHVSGGAVGGVNLDTYELNVTHAAANWARIKADEMPPVTPLSSDEKDKWLAWIEQGTPE